MSSLHVANEWLLAAALLLRHHVDLGREAVVLLQRPRLRYHHSSTHVVPLNPSHQNAHLRRKLPHA